MHIDDCERSRVVQAVAIRIGVQRVGDRKCRIGAVPQGVSHRKNRLAVVPLELPVASLVISIVRFVHDAHDRRIVENLTKPIEVVGAIEDGEDTVVGSLHGFGNGAHQPRHIRIRILAGKHDTGTARRDERIFELAVRGVLVDVVERHRVHFGQRGVEVPGHIELAAVRRAVPFRAGREFVRQPLHVVAVAHDERDVVLAGLNRLVPRRLIRLLRERYLPLGRRRAAPRGIARHDLLTALRRPVKQVELTRAPAVDPAVRILVGCVRIERGRIRVVHEPAILNGVVAEQLVLSGVLVKQHFLVELRAVLRIGLTVRHVPGIGDLRQAGDHRVDLRGWIDHQRVRHARDARRDVDRIRICGTIVQHVTVEHAAILIDQRHRQGLNLTLHLRIPGLELIQPEHGSRLRAVVRREQQLAVRVAIHDTGQARHHHVLRPGPHRPHINRRRELLRESGKRWRGENKEHASKIETSPADILDGASSAVRHNDRSRVTERTNQPNDNSNTNPMIAAILCLPAFNRRRESVKHGGWRGATSTLTIEAFISARK